jgi:hypothetical protein
LVLLDGHAKVQTLAVGVPDRAGTLVAVGRTSDAGRQLDLAPRLVAEREPSTEFVRLVGAGIPSEWFTGTVTGQYVCRFPRGPAESVKQVDETDGRWTRRTGWRETKIEVSRQVVVHLNTHKRIHTLIALRGTYVNPCSSGKLHVTPGVRRESMGWH